MPRTVHVLALIAAFTSAGATIFIRRASGAAPRSRASGSTWWSHHRPLAAVFAIGGLGHVSALGFALFGLGGLIGTVGGRLLRFVSIEKVGAAISSALTNLNPLVSSCLAVLLLGERVTTAIVAGTVVIVAGTILCRSVVCDSACGPRSSPCPCSPRCLWRRRDPEEGRPQSDDRGDGHGRQRHHGARRVHRVPPGVRQSRRHDGAWAEPGPLHRGRHQRRTPGCS